jgi:hypothetical protein
MNCKDIQDQIKQPHGAWSLSAEASAHVASCAVCARSVNVARVQRLLLNAVARQQPPEAVHGFEQRVLAHARPGPPNDLAASLVGRIAWRLTPALAVIIVALAVMAGTPDTPSNGGLTTLLSQVQTMDDGWATELAHVFGDELTADATR